MRRIIAVVVSLCMIATGAFIGAPQVTKIVPSADMEVSAASYPSLKTINYKATGDQRKDIIGFAKTQTGYTEKGNDGTYFGAWFGMKNQPWCAMFVCWSASKAGVSTSVIPRIANADRSWAKKQKVYYKSKQWGGNYTPKSGDLIYFSWSVRDYADHIGMVTGTGKVNGVTHIYTIEGNKSNKVKTGSYAYNSKYILGYASPKYTSKGVTTKATTTAKYTVTYNANGGQNPPANQTKEKGKTLVLQKGVPTRVGFTFLGWAESADATSAKYKAGANYTADKAVTLFAVWQDNTYQVKITKDGGLPKRTGPGLNYEQKGTLAKDSTVTVVETKDGWGKLNDGYWIMLKYTQEVAKPTTTTKATTKSTTTTTKPAANSVGVYRTTGDLFKRSGPAKTYAQKGVLKKGTKVTVVEIKNGWGKMADGTWSSMKYLEKLSDPTTTTKKTTTTKAPTTTKATTSAPSGNSNKEFTVRVNDKSGLNMRSGPGTSYKKKGTLAYNKKLTIKKVKGGWGQIKGNNNWIKLNYTRIVSGYKVKVTIPNLHMRKGAGKNYKSYGFIKPGTYEIVKLNNNGEWGKLKTNGRWIMLKYSTRV